jgi:hypothetical protein
MGSGATGVVDREKGPSPTSIVRATLPPPAPPVPAVPPAPSPAGAVMEAPHAPTERAIAAAVTRVARPDGR